jgi:NADH:ubiquinone reductase (non-electrogenic)
LERRFAQRFAAELGERAAEMAAWSRIGRGAQLSSLSQSLSRIVSEGGGGAPLGEAASALRGASALSRARGYHASSLHSFAFPGVAGSRSAGAGIHLLQTPPGSRGIVTTPARLQPASSAAVAAELSDAETREPEAAPAPPPRMPSLGPTEPAEKPRLVVLGTGWAACRLLKDVDTSAYDVVCVSPRNHMVFTPLLASTCVGTLEFRSVVEPVSRIQSALATRPGSYFFLANCTGVDTKAHEVYCTAAVGEGLPSDPYNFKIAYDKLVIASGAEPLTFNIKGVKENAIFLREVSHAQEIRRKLLTNLMLSENPGSHNRRKMHYVDHDFVSWALHPSVMLI